MPIRVAQWGTGWLGRQAVLGVLDHPDLELVGLYTATAAKEGQDAGALVGAPATGIVATSHVGDLLALKPDCHIFMLLGHLPGTVEPAVEQICAILEAGQNVVQTSIIQLCYPTVAPPELRRRVEAACERGDSRCYTTGIYPGVMTDAIPLSVLGCCEQVDSIRVTEMLNYSEYYEAGFAQLMGVGGQVDGAVERMEGNLSAFDAHEQMGGAIRHLGQRLGVTIDEVRITEVDVAPAVNRVAFDDFVIEPGTLGAYRFATEGLIEGRPVITIGFVTRFDDDAAPEWPRPHDGGPGCYRLEVVGSVSFSVDINFIGRRSTMNQTRGFPASSAVLGANLLCSSALLNTIPALLDAPTGLYGSMDLDRGRSLRVLRPL